MHALIIEDAGLISIQIEIYLRDIGFTSFDIATTEVDAVALAAARCPDLIIADEKLASGSGILAVKSICATTPAPVVFVTGYPKTVCRGIPTVTVLTKPFGEATLHAAISNLLPQIVPPDPSTGNRADPA